MSTVTDTRKFDNLFKLIRTSDEPTKFRLHMRKDGLFYINLASLSLTTYRFRVRENNLFYIDTSNHILTNILQNAFGEDLCRILGQ